MKNRIALIAVIALMWLSAVAHAGTLTLPENIDVIDAGAFEGLAAVETAVLPEGVTAIESRAFADSSIASINLPASLESIAADAFAGCDGLTASVLPGTYAMEFCVENGIAYSMSATPAEAFAYTVADGAVTITGYTGAYTEVIIPAAIEDCPVTAIAQSAFKGNKTVATLFVPGTVTDIGSTAFQNCASLTSAYLTGGVSTLGEKAFDGCTALESVSLPASLAAISNSAFSGCASLREIALPEGLLTIGNRAFENCAGLVSVGFPTTLTTIGDYAFQKCTALESVAFSEGLTTIGIYAFNKCTAMTDMDLPDSVTSIGSYAFGSCVSLTYFDYPLSLSKVPNIANVFTGVIPGCTNITEVTIPEGVTVTPAYLFSNCASITKVNLPATLVTIGNRSFGGCTGIQEITLPGGLVTIGEYAFDGCTGMTAVEMPASLERVEKFAFQNCSALKSVAYPEGMTYLGCYAHSGCKALETADLPDSLESLGEGAFKNCVSLKAFDYPFNWKHRPYLGNSADILKGCTLITEITVPEGVTQLPDRAFEGCDKLVKVNLPSTLNTVSQFAFANCTSLVSCDIPYGVQHLNWGSFKGCTSLLDIYLPTTVSEGGSFPDSWFSNHHADFTLESEYGAAAIDYAIKYGLNYYYLSYTGRHYPKGTLYKGDVFNITGYVRATLPLTEVTATIRNADTGEIVREKTVSPGVKNYSLANAINTAMDLDTLDLGSYTFTLKAATEKTSETFVSTSFTMVPPPLRVYLRDYQPLNGFISTDVEQTVSGTVVANYPITSLTVQLIADTEEDAPIEYTVAPGTNAYDLSALSITSAGLEANAYTMQIVVQGNGESKTVGKTGFSLTDDAIPEGFTVDYDALSAFIENADNKYLFLDFSVDYRLTIESNMTETERFNLAMSQRNDQLNASIRDGLDEILLGVDDADTYLIELYKKEIADFIVDMGASAETYTYDADMSKWISESIVNYQKINVDYITDNYGGIPESDMVFLEGMGSVMEKVSDVSGYVDTIGELAEIVDVIYQDYSRGIEILEYLSTEYVGNAQYQYAVDELKCEYYSQSYRAFNNLFTYAYKQAVDDAAEAFTDLVLKAMGGEVYAIFKIADLAEEVLDKAYDIYGDSNDYLVYSTQCETFQNARSAFEDAFDLVAADLSVVENVVKLKNSFEITRLSAIRAIDTLLNMKHYDCVDETYPVMDRKTLKTLTIGF